MVNGIGNGYINLGGIWVPPDTAVPKTSIPKPTTVAAPSAAPVGPLISNLPKQPTSIEQIIFESQNGKVPLLSSTTKPLATTAEAAAASGGIMASLKAFWNFLMGEWGKPLGDMYRAAKKATPDKVSITKFDWAKGYKAVNADIAAKKLAEAGVKKGFLGKIFSKLFSKLGPLMIAGFTLHRVYNGIKAGGIPEGLKEAAKGAIGLIGFAIGSVIAGMIGLTGIGAFLVPLVVSMAIDWGANMVLGGSLADKQAIAEQQQQEIQNSPLQMPKDPIMEEIQRRMSGQDSTNIASQTTPGRTRYIA